MTAANWFNLLPEEIPIGIFRDYFNYDEKLKMLKDDYFWQYLSSPYAWKEKLNVSLKTLKGASENLLYDIESGYYSLKGKYTLIIKVSKNVKRGTVTVETFIPKNRCLNINSNQPKLIKEYASIDRVKSLFNDFKSNYRFLKYNIYTDRWGLNIFDIDPKFFENMMYYVLYEVPEMPNVYIYKKYQYLVYIISDEEFCKRNPCSGQSFLLELHHLLNKIIDSNCNKIMKCGHFFAFKMRPWRMFYKCRMKTIFNYMLRKNMIKITTKLK